MRFISQKIFVLKKLVRLLNAKKTHNEISIRTSYNKINHFCGSPLPHLIARFYSTYKKYFYVGGINNLVGYVCALRVYNYLYCGNPGH